MRLGEALRAGADIRGWCLVVSCVFSTLQVGLWKGKDISTVVQCPKRVLVCVEHPAFVSLFVFSPQLFSSCQILCCQPSASGGEGPGGRLKYTFLNPLSVHMVHQISSSGQSTSPGIRNVTHTSKTRSEQCSSGTATSTISIRSATKSLITDRKRHRCT
jgi:hypothetical protein